MKLALVISEQLSISISTISTIFRKTKTEYLNQRQMVTSGNREELHIGKKKSLTIEKIILKCAGYLWNFFPTAFQTSVLFVIMAEN